MLGVRERSMDLEELPCDLTIDLLYRIQTVLKNYPTKDAVQTAWLSATFYFMFLKSGAMKLLDHAIQGIKYSVVGTHIDDPDCARFLKIFMIRMQAKRYEHSNSLEDLQRAVLVAEEVVRTTPKDHLDGTSQFAVDLNHLITMLLKRYKHIKAEEAPDDVHSDEGWILKGVGSSLWNMFQHTGNVGYLQLSIDWTGEAIHGTRYGHPDRGMRLTSLGAGLAARFKETRNLEDLHEAIRRDEEALACTRDGHPRKSLIIINLASSLSLRFKITSKLNDLEESIRRAEEAVDATPKEDPDRGRRLSLLASVLAIRFEKAGCDKDLEQAIGRDTEALACTQSDEQARSSILANLGANLCLRFDRSRKIDDLQAAIRNYEEAVDVTPDGHPFRYNRLQNLGRCFGMRFELTGSVDDLQICIDRSEEAAACIGDGKWDRSLCLSSLAHHYNMRYLLTSDMDNLDLAIRRCREAIACTSQDHADRASFVHVLGHVLVTRFHRTGDRKDLDESVCLSGEALDATPDSNPNRPNFLQHWAYVLRARFKVTDNLDDLEMVIRRIDDYLASRTFENHRSRMLLLPELSKSLWLRFKNTRKISDMESAIQKAEEALADVTSSDKPSDRVNILSDLASYLERRFEEYLDPGDYARSIRLRMECIEMHNLPPSVRIRAAVRAFRLLLATVQKKAKFLAAGEQQRVKFLAGEQKWVELSRIADIAVKLLPSVSPRALKQRDQQYTVEEFAGLAPFAAVAALQAGKEASYALELLELGRGIIAGLKFEAWTDLADLRDQHRGMAEKFEWLRQKMDKSPSSSRLDLEGIGGMGTFHSRVTQRHNDSREFEKIVDEIRHLPNFKYFLLPPQTDQLKAVASSGPIVLINVTRFGCDAFLLDGHTVRTLHLPLLLFSDIEENVKRLRLIRNGQTSSPEDQMSLMLAWLWDVAAGPILDELGFRGPPSDGTRPRLWWIPTSILSPLPLHAAGHHSPESSETVLDRVVSSYSPSIRALLHARQSSQQKIRTFDDVLLVSMQATPGKSDLTFAAEEVKLLSQILSDSPSTLASIAQVTKKPGEPLKQPSKDAVLDRLRTCSVFHFAGHGLSDPLDPSKSSLLLTDWKRNPLTVEDLVGLNLHQKSPWLAYLSACSTRENQAEGLEDEAIHLVTACQLAGFQHAVGSLWEVSDRYSVDAATHFYKSIKDGGVVSDAAIAWAAHNAARLLREDTRNQDRRMRQGRPQEEDVDDEIEGGNPLIWAAYVHVGP